ncbi:MAG: MCE family protein [Alphaproteobacteria bacterium]|nr:MCE family protein [Alphaproteobacteria bacterium]
MQVRKFFQQQKEFMAGLIIVAGFSFVLSVFFQQKKDFVDTDKLVVHATYNKVDGVNVGSAVRLAGIPIGYVSNIQLDGYYRVRMTFTLDTDVVLPVDSAAMIETNGLLGGKYIEVLPGGEEDIMVSGDDFFYTQDVLLLDELLDRFLSLMRIKKGVVENAIKGDE